MNRNRRALVPTSRESDDNDRWTPPVRVSTTSDIATPTLLIAGRAASCVLQCQTPPRVHYNCVADIHWECVVRCLFGSATLTRCRWRQFHLVLDRFIRFRRTGECRARSCHMGLCDGVWMNYLNRQRVMSHLVSQVPSTHAVLVFRRASFVRCLACSDKGWHDCSHFRPGVGAYLLSRCCVPRAGRLLQHGGIRQGIAC